MYLLDTGGLFAAIHQAHASHERIHRWLESVDRFSTCGLTQIGVFRLLLTDAAMQGCPLDPVSAHAVLAQFTHLPRHVFLPCSPPAEEFVGQASGSQAAFDDYLVQIASEAGGKLATLDTRLATRWRKHTIIIR